MTLQELRKRALRAAKKEVRREKFKPDHLIVQAVQTIDELDEMSNMMTERVRNWYALHYPELEKLVKSPETYLAIINDLRHRKQMIEAGLEKYVPADRAKRIAMIAMESIGADLEQKDLDRIAMYANLAMHAHKERGELAAYVEDAVGELCPNTHALVGGMLTGRLIALAGSVERLAKMPASTVQVLGAEKALFAHLRQGVAPPKHGVIFAYPAIRQATKKKRGKIARVLSNKISIAVRMDYFKHGDDGGALKAQLDEKIEGIMKR